MWKGGKLNQDDFNVRTGSEGISSRGVTSKLRTEVPTRADKQDGQIRALKARLSEPVFPVFRVA